MIKKRVLLADTDAGALEEFRQALGEEWHVTAVANGTAALADLESKPCDVVVADLDLAEIDGTELLNRIQSLYPRTIRFVLAREADRERMVKQVLGEHQFLGKPLERVSLKASIERALALEALIPRNSIRDLVARIRTLPTIPTLYLKVQTLLKSPDVTTAQVGEVIAKDMAMMTKLLRVINSACYALPRKITDPTEAVGILGFETVGSMVLAIKLLTQYDKVKPVYFSIDRLWKHSTDVARSAKIIANMHSENRALAEAAFTAGLMHDLGKVVLASNFDDQYRGVQSLARKQQLPLCDVEREIFGASHGEIGAYLLGLWGMPLDVLEAAARHHHPSQGTSKEFSALTAVHVANALEYEKRPEADGMIISKIDEAYLSEIGMLKYLPAWRARIVRGQSGKTEFIFANAKTAPANTATATATTTASPEVAPVATSVVKSPASPAFSFHTPWIYATAGAAVIILLVIWLVSDSIVHNLVALPGRTIDVAARSTDANSRAPSPANDSTTASTPESAKTSQTSKAAVDTTTKPSATLASTASLAPKPASGKATLGDLKLQGIFFSSKNPTAIINGKMVRVNDLVGDIRVVEIKNSTVTLEYKKQRQTLVLKTTE